MKTKRDPESMQQVREVLRWRVPSAELDGLSDEELADKLDQMFAALDEWLPKFRAAMEETGASIGRAVARASQSLPKPRT